MKTYHFRVDTEWYFKAPSYDGTRYNQKSWDQSFQLSASVRLDNWRNLIAQGKCATTPRDGLKQSGTYRPGYFEASSPDGWEWHGQYSGGVTAKPPPALSVTDMYAVEQSALSKFSKNAQSVLQAFDGLTFTGELLETLRMIRNPAKALRKSMGQYLDRTRRNKFRKRSKLKPGTRDFQKASTDSYLEATYGWQPIVSDIDSGMEALTRWVDPTKRLIHVIGKSVEESETLYATYNPTYGPVRVTIPVWDSFTDTVRFRGAIKWDPAYQHSFGYYGVSLRNILPSAWELLPYSFLVDYFTNIGDILSAWSFGRSQVAWVDRTRHRKTVRSEREARVLYWDHSTAEGTHFVRPEHIKFTTTSFDRGQYLGTLVPDFTWELPGVGSRKWLNIAALGLARM
jgi:hypothetical protein